MNSNKNINKDAFSKTNLIGENNHHNFLVFQTTFGFALRGGAEPSSQSLLHGKRLISDVNILTPIENKQLMFSEFNLSN